MDIYILGEIGSHAKRTGLMALVPIGFQVLSYAFEGEVALTAERLIKRIDRASKKAKAVCKSKLKRP